MTREEAIKILEEGEVSQKSGFFEAYQMAIESLKQPEVIRCKDCKWFCKWDTTGGECNGFGDGGYVPEDGYCHNAERKEE